MDPFSVAVGALQIAGVCSQCTVTIIKFIGEIRTAEERIRGFYEEVIALKSTYEGLEESLRSPIMVEAARVANQTSDGAHLWAQVRIALDDSTKTMNRIKLLLDEISKKTGPLRRFKSQLQESLTNGELSRLRQRIQFFNATVALPINMVCVMLQLEQRGMSVDHQRQLDVKLASLERMMQNMIKELTQPSRTPTMMSGSTLIVGAPDDSVDPRGKDNYLSFARKILSTASAAASNRSSLSTVSPQIDPPSLIELGPGPPPYAQQPQQDRRRMIPEWIPAPNPTNRDLLAEMCSPADLPPAVPPESPMPRGKSYEVAYKLTHTHLKLGQEKAEQDNHDSAERSFRKALELLAKNDFSGRIAFQPAEVVLMLANSCLQQEKYHDAIALLTPVAERKENIFPDIPGTKAPTTTAPTTRPDTLQGLAASHMLGDVYRQKGDFEEAKKHALKAFLERTDELGEHDEKTLESVKLVIDVYQDMGDQEEADAYLVFLEPAPPEKRSEMHNRPSRPVVATEDETAVASASPPPSDVAALAFTPSPPPLSPQQDGKTSRTSFASKFRNKRKPSEPKLVSRSSASEGHRQSFSRTPTLDDTYLMSVFLPGTRTDTKIMSSPSETSHERTNSYAEELSTAPSSARLSRSPSIKTLEPTFLAVQQLCMEGKFGKACKIGISFLEGYSSSAFIIRKDALEKNIKEGGDKGLAATGHGYSAIHFFCELKEECIDEVSLLLRHGADPNAIAYKAGYSGSNSPDVLSPLHLAIRRGHSTIAKLLLESKDLKPDILNGEGFYPIMSACRRRNYTVVKGLLNHAPKSIPREYPSSWYGNSILHDVARHCDVKLLEILLDTGLFDMNQQDKFGKTPLMHAVIKSDVHNPVEKHKLISQRQQVVEKLLEAGAGRHYVDVKGLTARQYADMEREGEGSRDLISVLGEARFELG
jgi:Ankyrin repeats (3 copies)/Ankyrin repeats (many copies)/Tetratricopeptide repeat